MRKDPSNGPKHRRTIAEVFCVKSRVDVMAAFSQLEPRNQILQWHHLLSGVAPSETGPDLRLQSLADGMFDFSHNVVAVLGLALI